MVTSFPKMRLPVKESVHISSMTDMDNQNHKNIILNLLENPVITDPNPV